MKKDKNNKNLLISVIIPVYNASEYLDKCLESVLSQTLKNIEVICVDDGSTDNSVEIIRNYAASDDRIILVQQTNKGAGAARNLGLQYARGKYVHFLDADDWLELSAYEESYKVIEDTQADVCVFLYIRYDNIHGTERKVKLFDTGKDTYRITNFATDYRHLCNTSVVPWNKLYRCEFLKKINAYFDEIICANDRAFYFQVITQAQKIVKLSEYLIYYRENNANSLVGSSREKHFDCHLVANKRIFDIGRGFPGEVFRQILNTNMLDLFSFFTKSGQDQKIDNFIEIRDLLNTNLLNDTIKEYSASSWYANGKIALLSYGINSDKKIIPIVFATNNSYAPFLDVAILSLIANMNNEYYYDIYVLETELSQIYINRLEAHNGASYRVNCVNIKSKLAGKEFVTRAHYSKEMYYRILIPELFYHYDKVLYFDCDIIINKDVAELYKLDVNGKCIAAVHNALNGSMFRYVKNMLHLIPEKYFNSGILIININEFVKQKIKTKCFDLLKVKDNLVCPDQDLLNLACRDSAILIDSAWNYQWHGMLPGAEKVESISEKSLKNAADKKYIIHYTSGKKAWMFPEYADAIYFWQYVDQSQFATEISQIGISKRMSATIHDEINRYINYRSDKIDGKSTDSKQKSNITSPSLIKKFFISLNQVGFKATMKKVINRLRKPSAGRR